MLTTLIFVNILLDQLTPVLNSITIFENSKNEIFTLDFKAMEHDMIGTCNNCSYSKGFKFGGGRLKFQNVCLGPAINTKTGKIETVNYKMYDPILYKIYADTELQSKHPEYLSKYKYGNFSINPTGNYCPSCQNKTFDFSVKVTVE